MYFTTKRNGHWCYLIPDLLHYFARWSRSVCLIPWSIELARSFHMSIKNDFYFVIYIRFTIPHPLAMVCLQCKFNMKKSRRKYKTPSKTITQVKDVAHGPLSLTSGRHCCVWFYTWWSPSLIQHKSKYYIY